MLLLFTTIFLGVLATLVARIALPREHERDAARRLGLVVLGLSGAALLAGLAGLLAALLLAVLERPTITSLKALEPAQGLVIVQGVVSADSSATQGDIASIASTLERGRLVLDLEDGSLVCDDRAVQNLDWHRIRHRGEWAAALKVGDRVSALGARWKGRDMGSGAESLGFTPKVVARGGPGLIVRHLRWRAVPNALAFLVGVLVAVAGVRTWHRSRSVEVAAGPG